MSSMCSRLVALRAPSVTTGGRRGVGDGNGREGGQRPAIAYGELTPTEIRHSCHR